jgi:hypothetical protein
MSTCNLDHSWEDVKKKLTEQQPFLPKELHDLSIKLLSRSPNQNELNELFHLLKKYDLANDEEKSERNQLLFAILR